MKFIIAGYLFIETLALLMVFTILTAAPDAHLMGQYERFGYATAAIGASLFVVNWLKNKFKPETGSLIIVGALCYPIFLWGLYELVSESPKWLPDRAKPAALQRAFRTISDEKASMPDGDHVNSALRKLPIPDDSIRQINLDGVRAIAQLYESMPRWVSEFDRSKYQEPAERSVLNNVIHYPDFLNRFDNALAASLLGVLSPLTSRTFQQWSSLSYVDPVLLRSLRAKNHMEIMNDDLVHLAERRFLREVEEQFDRLNFDLSEKSIVWDVVLRRAITAQILDEAGIPGGVEHITFPWLESQSQFMSSDAFEQVLYVVAPYFFDANNTFLLDKSLFSKPDKVGRMISHFEKGLSPVVKAQFVDFYQRLGSRLMNDVTAWRVPIAEPLFSGWLRIGAILPMMCVLSLVLLLSNTLRLCRQGVIPSVAALSMIVMAVGIFMSPWLNMIINLILPISIPEPILFSG